MSSFPAPFFFKSTTARRFSHRKGIIGFSLVEVLVSLGIFMILIAFVAHSVMDASRTALRDNEKMDSLGEARQALDRFAIDWAARVRRSDVNGVFTKKSGGDEISFLSQVPAYSGSRLLAVVSYRVNPATSMLERGILGYGYSDSDGDPSLEFPSTPEPTPAATPAGVNQTDYEVLSNAVFRLNFCFLRKSNGTFTVDSTLNLNSDDVAGIVITVAAIDQRNRVILNNQQLAALAAALPDVGDGQDPQSVWTAKVNSGSLSGDAKVPVQAAAAVRIYQRVFPLNE